MANATTAVLNQTADNSTALGQGQVLGNMSWQAVVIIIVLILVVGAIAFAAIWKRRGRKQRTSSPFVKALFLTAAITIFVIVIEGAGWLGPEGLPMWLKIAMTALLFVGLYIFFGMRDQFLQERVTKTYVERIRTHLKEHFFTEFNIGDSAGSQVPYHRVLPNNEYGGEDKDVVYYLAFTAAGTNVLYVFGLKTGIPLEVDENPAPEKVAKIFKKKLKALQAQQAPHTLAQESIQRLGQPQNAEPTTTTT